MSNVIKIEGNGDTPKLFAFFLFNHAGLKEQYVSIDHICSEIPDCPLTGILKGYKDSSLIIQAIAGDYPTKPKTIPVKVTQIKSVFCPETETFIELSSSSIPSIKECPRIPPGGRMLESSEIPCRTQTI